MKRDKAIILTIVLLLFYTLKYSLSPNSEHSIRCRGVKSDSVKVLLTRIEHSTTINKRIPYIHRYVFISSVLTIILFIIWNEKFPQFKSFLRGFIISFSILMAQHGYFYHHSDKFVHAYVYENTQLLRKKLHKKRINNSSFLKEYKPCYLKNKKSLLKYLNW